MDDMADSNGTNETIPMCKSDSYKMYSATNDLVIVLMGQPVFAKLLWTAIHSRKTDVLNINLAFFHNLQYLLTMLHLLVILLYRQADRSIAMFLFVYVLIGGPMTLSFICLERYIAVVHPTVYPLLRTYRCREACALSVWLLSLPIALVKAFSIELHSEWNQSMDSVAYSILVIVVIVMWVY
ncbi:hypothetical protein NHX12_024198 [Muraenolepis orangiensis]|uniref:G-protein coupled receptors family 1 profile domain-containing protein n=1 Tax=Muraenolepis orangiensis TaxID=630683 RepID=A0A9Q0IUK5_9TELE|nr:hypothetical protein NHX12_024198 [Muraenolepis orangiensis]